MVQEPWVKKPLSCHGAGAACKLSDKERDEGGAHYFFSNPRLGRLGNNPLTMLGICLAVGSPPPQISDVICWGRNDSLILKFQFVQG